jgi:ketosteroid isomerase-like protein
MKKLIFLAVVAICLSACDNDKGKGHHHVTAAYMDSLRNDLLNTDIAFSKLSEDKGRNAAFVEYAADNATLLRPFSAPLTGRDTIKAMLSTHPDSTYKLTWTPISSDVAKSGEIGFTYGTYSLDIKNVGHEEGTYATVWHKDSTKTWKFILDTGNEGLSSTEKKTDAKIDAKKK